MPYRIRILQTGSLMCRRSKLFFGCQSVTEARQQHWTFFLGMEAGQKYWKIDDWLGLLFGILK